MTLSGGKPVLTFASSVILITLIYWHSNVFLKNHYDDSYITYRYAVNTARGEGIVFNAGERTDAASSFLYTIILAGSCKAGLTDLETVSAVIGIVSAGLVACLVFLSTRLLVGGSLVPFLLALLSSIHGLTSGWAVSGMETTFFSFLVVLFCYRTFLLQKSDMVTVLLLWAAALTRMEGALLVIAWLVSGLAEMRKNGAADRGFIARAGLVFLALGAFYAFKFVYYGALVSHALQIKNILRYYAPDPVGLLKFWGRTSLAVLSLAVAGIVLARRDPRVLGLSAYFVLSWLSVLCGPSADWGRYSAHLLPLSFVLSAIALGAVRKHRRALLTVALTLVFLQAAGSAASMRKKMIGLSAHQECRKAVGEFLNRTVDAKEVIASSDIGAIAYTAASFRFVDLAGLTSRDVLDLYRKGRNPDSILDSRRVRFIADTFQGVKGSGFSDHPLLRTPGIALEVPVPASRYAVGTDRPLFSCTRDGKLFFLVARLSEGRAQPPP